MRLFFDTSALIPVFLEDHEHHEPSLNVFLRADKKSGWFGVHSLAEIYATVTRLPGKHRLSGDQVLLFLDNLIERMNPIALNPDEYSRVIKSSASRGTVGGAIYDALLAECALKAKADLIYSWNIRHFQQFGPEVVKRLRTP